MTSIASSTHYTLTVYYLLFLPQGACQPLLPPGNEESDSPVHPFDENTTKHNQTDLTTPIT